MGSSTYLVYGGGASTDMSNPTTKPAGAKKLEKVTLQYIAYQQDYCSDATFACCNFGA
jgi:hypothetical protein